MSAEKKASQQSKGPSFFVRLGKRIGKFFKDYRSELQKVVWPTKEDTAKKSTIVITSLVICALVLGGIDYAFGQLILWLGTLAG